MSDKQQTIKTSISISGTGLHTGNKVTLSFHPASENFGYKFKRTDLDNEIEVPADVEHVVDTSRGTSIEYQGIRIDTIEHVLAALAGLEIDNVLVELDQSETPILDGSAVIYVEKTTRSRNCRAEGTPEILRIGHQCHLYGCRKEDSAHCHPCKRAPGFSDDRL